MAIIEFQQELKEVIAGKIQRYFIEELDQEIGQFQAEFLMDFFSEEIGPYYYNQALSDARVMLDSKLESITDVFYEIEKPVI